MVFSLSPAARASAALAVVTTLAAAQDRTPDAEPTPSATDVAAVIDALGAAHRVGGEPPRAYDRFAARMVLTPAQRDADRVTITTDVRFRDAVAPTPPLIRYSIEEGDRTFQRGRDRRGYWAILDPQRPPTSLEEREYADDKAAVKRELVLARQLLRFLEPRAIAAALTEPSAERTDFPWARAAAPSIALRGTLDAYPFYTSGDTGTARLELWLDAETHRLRAVRARPVDGRGERTGDDELITLTDWREHSGALVPATLVFYRLDGERPEPLAQIRLETLDLDPELDPAAFDRDTGK